MIAHQEITQRLRCAHHVDDATAESLISAETSPKATVASFDDAQELTKGQVGVGCGAELVGDSCEHLVVIERRECPKRVQQCPSLVRLDETATSETACSGCVTIAHGARP